MKSIVYNKNLKVWMAIVTVLLFLLTMFFTAYLQLNFFNIEGICIIAMLFSVYLIKRDKLLLSLTIFLSLILNYFSDNLGFGKELNIILDYFIILMAIKLFYMFICKKLKLNILTKIMSIFIVFCIIGYFINMPSGINFIKVMYFDYLRYFIVCLSALYFIYDDKYIIRMFKFIDIFIILQIPIIVIQLNKLALNYTGGYVIQDYASGLLGGKSTAELGGILIVLFITIFVLFINKDISINLFIINTIFIIIISILSEIKFVLFFIPVVVLVISLKKINLKTIIIFIISMVLVFEGMNIIAKINPGFKNFFNKDNITSYINHSYGGSGISRGNSMSIANSYIKYDFNKIIVGNGIGSSTDSLNQKSEFGRSNIYYFRMFYWPYIFVETGYIGIILMIIIYGIILRYSFKLTKSTDKMKLYIGQIGIPLIVLLIFMNYYAMSMVKYNFSIFIWSLFGVIAKQFYRNQEENK